MTIEIRPLLLLAGILLLALADAGCQTFSDSKSVEIPTVETPEDQALSNAVRNRLLANKDLDLTGIRVVSNGGTVYLTGTVGSLDARQHAVKTAWEVRGVQSVVNSLNIRK